MLLVDQLLGVLKPIAELSVILPATSLFVNSQLVLFNFVWAIKRVHQRNNAATRSEVPKSVHAKLEIPESVDHVTVDAATIQTAGHSLHDSAPIVPIDIYINRQIRAVANWLSGRWFTAKAGVIAKDVLAAVWLCSPR
jgi:hypothetical protein